MSAYPLEKSANGTIVDVTKSSVRIELPPPLTSSESMIDTTLQSGMALVFMNVLVLTLLYIILGPPGGFPPAPTFLSKCFGAPIHVIDNPANLEISNLTLQQPIKLTMSYYQATL